MEKFTRNYVNRYSKIVLRQPLKEGRFIEQIFEKIHGSGRPEGAWKVSYNAFSEYPICIYDGVFRSCESCDKNINGIGETGCTGTNKVITGSEVAERCNDCAAAHLRVDFMD